MRLWAACVVASVLGSGALAQETRFSGKPLTILVNYDAGGPTDIEARVLGRHLGKHLPGQPTVVVQNMGGAAGLVGTKYLGEIAPRDGYTMGYLTAATQRYVTNPDQFKVDFRNYEFVALAPSGRVHFTRKDVSVGLSSAQDLLKAQVIVGGLGPDAPKDLAMRLTLDLLGVKYKYVTGYNSSSQAFLALQRGEITHYADSPADYFGKVLPLVQKGELMPVFFDPGFDGSTFTIPRQMQAVGVLPFHDYFRQVKGRDPQGDLWEAYKSLLMVNGSMYRLLALPPSSPIELRDALRKAVVALNEDRAYQEEARQLMGDAPEYVSSAHLNQQVRSGLTLSPQLKNFMQDYVRRAR
jgi:Tripartite tricarboxylate transporter family receptor